MAVPTTAAAEDRPVLVFAAASLKNALDAIAADWTASGGARAMTSHAASSVLARQISAGAPVDLFVSADAEWMDWLAARGLIRPETRRVVIGNRLVLIAPANSTATLRIAPGFALAAALAGGVLAMADPRAVPAGKYGEAALTALGVWPDVARRIARADNARTALVFVARGEAPFGIVYASDAHAEKRVRVVDLFPAATHPPIVYPAALTRDARHPDAARFLDHLVGAAARAQFLAHGFTALD